MSQRYQRKWTEEEDKRLCAVVKEQGDRVNWSAVARHFPERSQGSTRCRERWSNVLDPNVNRGPWTEQEDQMIRQLYSHPYYQQHSSKWAEIAKALGTGRTSDRVKSHANTLLQLKRKHQTVRSNSSNHTAQPYTYFPAVVTPNTDDGDDQDLQQAWRRQLRARRKGEWRPTGGWMPPKWAVPSNANEGIANQDPSTMKMAATANPPTADIRLVPKNEEEDPVLTAIQLFNHHQRRNPKASQNQQQQRQQQRQIVAGRVADLIYQHMPLVEELKVDPLMNHPSLPTLGADGIGTRAVVTTNTTPEEIKLGSDDEPQNSSAPNLVWDRAYAQIPKTEEPVDVHPLNPPNVQPVHFGGGGNVTVTGMDYGIVPNLAEIPITNKDETHAYAQMPPATKNNGHSDRFHSLGTTTATTTIGTGTVAAASVGNHGVFWDPLSLSLPPMDCFQRRFQEPTQQQQQQQQLDTNLALSLFLETETDAYCDASALTDPTKVWLDDPAYGETGADNGMSQERQHHHEDQPDYQDTSLSNASRGKRKRTDRCVFTSTTTDTIRLSDVRYPGFVTPSDSLLIRAHTAMHELLPEGDCESLDVVRLAVSYYDYWRPQHTKVILLAESHAFTDKQRALHGPSLDRQFLSSYGGPRGFVSLVYCFGYGEDEALTDTQGPVAIDTCGNSASSKRGNAKEPPNKGTPQFWSLLAAASRGTTVPSVAKPAKSKTAFASDVLKGGGLPVAQRLEAKLEILRDLQRRGIWLLDASLFGWYISQPQKYRRSKATNEVHRLQKARPPPQLKAPALIMAWEMYTKHVVRQVAEEGSLRALIPIGKEVEAILTRERMEEAIHVTGLPHTHVMEAFPAPNAWIPGGYGPFYTKLSELVWDVAPPCRPISDDRTNIDDRALDSSFAAATDLAQ